MTGLPVSGGYPPPPLRGRAKDRITYDCDDCGTPTTRARTKDEPRVCVGCGIERGIQAAREMANKSGPAYDRWLSSNGPRGRGAAK